MEKLAKGWEQRFHTRGNSNDSSIEEKCLTVLIKRNAYLKYSFLPIWLVKTNTLVRTVYWRA